MKLPDVLAARFYMEHAGALLLPGFAVGAQLDTEFGAYVSPDRGRQGFVRNALAASSALRSIVEPDGFVSWLNAVFKQTMRPIGGDATRYVGATYWHRDVSDGSLVLAKLAVYLDSASFLYVPGSHTPEFAAAIPTAAENICCGDATQTLAFRANDAILFCPRLLHSVAEAEPRRQLAVIFSAVPATSDQRSELMRLLAANSAVL